MELICGAAVEEYWEASAKGQNDELDADSHI
jgi:hypothetical protein